MQKHNLAPLARAGYDAVGRGVVVVYAEQKPMYLNFAEWMVEAALALMNSWQRWSAMIRKRSFLRSL